VKLGLATRRLSLPNGDNRSQSCSSSLGDLLEARAPRTNPNDLVAHDLVTNDRDQLGFTDIDDLVPDNFRLAHFQGPERPDIAWICRLGPCHFRNGASDSFCFLTFRWLIGFGAR
jgi:hypothetical protein